MACRSSTRANETFFVEITDVSGADVGDSHGVGTITNDDVATPAFEVVISQIYGGGNAGATLRHDYIELFNRGLTPLDLTDWSVQYSSAPGSTWAVTALSGMIEPGRYYLVREAAGADGDVDGPAPEASGSIAMAASSGRVALSSGRYARACRRTRVGGPDK